MGQFLLIGIVLAGAPWAARTLPAGQSGAALKFAGAILLAVGLGVVTRAGLALGPTSRRRGTAGGGTLVTEGIYNLVRHPLYAGLIIGLTGYALLWGNSLVGLGAASPRCSISRQGARRGAMAATAVSRPMRSILAGWRGSFRMDGNRTAGNGKSEMGSGEWERGKREMGNGKREASPDPNCVGPTFKPYLW